MKVAKRCTCPKRCDHPYWYDFKVRGQRHRGSTHLTVYDDAYTFARNHQQDVRQGTPRIAPVSIAEHVAAYVEWAQGDHPKTADKDARTLERFLNVVGRAKPTDRITPFDIERWRSVRLRAVERNTVNRETYILSGCFSKAVKWRRCATNPVREVEKYRIDDTRVRVLSAEEIKLVLTQAPPDLALICRVTLECLPRLSEVLSIHRTDIGPGWLQLRRKGGKVDRVPISPELQSLLLARLGGRDGYVFGDPPPTQAQVSHQFFNLFSRNKRRNALPLEGVSHHTMRHTGVTLKLEAGINPRTIQRLAGWSSLKMLERYGHTRDAEARRAVEGTAATLKAAVEGSQKGSHEESAAASSAVASTTLA